MLALSFSDSIDVIDQAKKEVMDIQKRLPKASKRRSVGHRLNITI